MRPAIREPLQRRARESVGEVVRQYGAWIQTIGTEDRDTLRLHQQLTALAGRIDTSSGDSASLTDLDKSEANLLVSCAVFSITNLVHFIHDEVENRQQFAEATSIVRELYSVAIEFSSDAVRIIPRLDEKNPRPEDVQRIVHAVNEKVRSGAVWPMPSLAEPVYAEHPQNIIHLESVADYVESDWVGGVEPVRHPIPRRPLPHVDHPGSATGNCVAFGASPPAGEPGLDKEPRFPVDLDCFSIPALRVQVEADRELLDLAMGLQQYRLAAATVCALLEAVILQLAIPRQADLELSGAPDTWDLHSLLLRCTRARGIVQERPNLERILHCRRLLAPAQQVTYPHDPRPAEIEGMLQSLRRFLAHVRFLAVKTSAP